VNRKKKRAPGENSSEEERPLRRLAGSAHQTVHPEGVRFGQAELKKEKPSAVSARQLANTPGVHFLYPQANKDVPLSFARKAVNIAPKSRKPERRLLSIRNNFFW
jgi:hypothetical protein